MLEARCSSPTVKEGSVAPEQARPHGRATAPTHVASEIANDAPQVGKSWTQSDIQ